MNILYAISDLLASELDFIRTSLSDGLFQNRRDDAARAFVKQVNGLLAATR